MGNNALIIGSGGREHALGEAVAPHVDTVYFSPGNAGTAQVENGLNVDVGMFPVTFANEHDVGLTIIGPEQPLVDGVADAFRIQGHDVLGPGRVAARLESSKHFATDFMTRHGIPHPKTTMVHNHDDAARILDDVDPTQWVLKADGLAGGKGVVLPETVDEFRSSLFGMLSGELFGGAGKNNVQIQERLSGPEVSAFVVSDGERFTILPLSQDHKRLLDDDQGPNTGGMGAYSPVPETIVNERQAGKIHDTAERTINGMREDGHPYKGVLYMGLMLAEQYDDDPVVIEYNVRFGDPEAQVVLPLLEKSGISAFDLFRSAAGNRISDEFLALNMTSGLGNTALTVCLAADGYPDAPIKGNVILGLDQTYEGVRVHHGGTKMSEDAVITSGGRVLYVTGTGETIDEAAASAYDAISLDGIRFFGNQYRTDIGKQARGQ